MLRRIAAGIFGLFILAALVLTAWYRIDGQPVPEARNYLEAVGYTAREERDGSLVFEAAAPNGHGVLIMHGALIKPLAYARTAAYFAERGYTVLVPAGALRLSIMAASGTAARLDEIPVRDWYFIGHSMGGFSSLEVLSRHPSAVRAIALWAAAIPRDFSGVTLPVLYLRGEEDGLLPPERFADARSKLPVSTRYVNVPGGNHRNFALYSHQFFDRDGTLGQEAQIDLANRETADFFAAH